MAAKLLIKKLDSAVIESAGRWKAGQIVVALETTDVLGSKEEVAANNFVHFTVTDKTVAEMEQYLSPWNKAVDMNVISGPDPQGFRRINVRNNNTNVSETKGGWTVEGTDDIIAEWNERYPTCNLVTVTFPQYDTWTCEGTFTTGQATEFEEVVIAKGLAFMDYRRIWYITSAGMSNIIAAGGSQSGTAAQLSGIIRDGMLD